MVCPRCIMTVEQILKENNLAYHSIHLGEVTLVNELTNEQIGRLSNNLQQVGFELLDDQKKQQIEQLKTLLIQKVQENGIEEHFIISKYLSEKMYKDYSSLSKLFSEVEGITIEHFFMLQKIEKVKEWLIYNELSLNEIAYKLGYSSTQHLSNQFKKLTGMTPGQFKKIGAVHRKPLDDIQAKNI